MEQKINAHAYASNFLVTDYWPTHTKDKKKKLRWPVSVTQEMKRALRANLGPGNDYYLFIHEVVRDCTHEVPKKCPQLDRSHRKE